ncbi:DUF4383 domain-containing protein [Nocardioides sp. cx-173]|uniref:DUF4383 domain-containing protein n=1 Tax=Nocardioides sp. cx-173 TaxID=2898796 RepID=UPI001E38E058|nr:DUF4383 domain-containing protein [Nocardioides sp. cx-173]MCD4527133.1 DUF4383 domain-containing protein [Nocardioides sp. cx-173]UGB42496.1 DUF4383 domain-containing protein [Nocardioides sp. cx-173]
MSVRDHHAGTAHAGRDKLAKTLALATGAVFLLVGVAGFIPGITTDYDTMKFAGHESRAELLGIFQVSILHNIVHLLFGVAGLALARKATTAIAYLVGGGIIYFVLWIYGLVIDHDHDANFVPLNDADNWLHLILAVGMVGMGLAAQRALRGDIGSQTPM